MKSILIYLLFFTSFAMCSGAFDNGTATGKGKFKLDLTINPFNKISFGQTYGVISYGITDRIDIHGYISDHSGNFTTIYGGIFYQFFKSDKNVFHFLKVAMLFRFLKWQDFSYFFMIRCN